MTSSNGNIFRVTCHLCGEFTGFPGEFPAQRLVTRNFDAFFDLRPNMLLSKQSWGWWFETPSRPLWRHRNVTARIYPAPHLSWLRRGSLDLFRVLLLFRWILGWLDFICPDTVQSMICAVDREHNGLEFVSCFMHATPYHFYRHGATSFSWIEHIRWKILEACVNAWVYFVESASKL